MERVVPATVFVNPAAGRGRAGRKVAEVRDAFARRDYSVTIVETGSAEELRSSARNSLHAGCTTLIAMGGDGTLQLVASEVIGHDARIGVIPAGGGNDFAAALRIPRNLQEAVGVIVRGKRRMVDAVRVRDHAGHESIYLGGGGMGLDAEAVGHASARFRMWPGRLRYLASAIAALRGFSGVQVEVEFPDSDAPKITEKVLLVAVLNTPTYGGGLRLAPAAKIDDGMLEVVRIEMLGKREVLALIPRLMITGELQSKRMVRASARRIRLSAQGETWFHGDGELLGIAPVEIEVLPKALRVFAP